MQNKTKARNILFSMVALLILAIPLFIIGFGGIKNESSTGKSDVVPKHIQIGDSIDFEGDVKDIISHYSVEGQNWVRMTYPDINHRDIALRLIGRKFPDFKMNNMNGKELELDKSKKVVFLLNKSNTDTTKRMAKEIESFKVENSNIDVIEFYPLDSDKDVSDFKEANEIKLDKGMTVAGNGSRESTTLQSQLHAEFLPMAVYIDEERTIAYVLIGYHDKVYLNEAVESAFGRLKFYDYIQTN